MELFHEAKQTLENELERFRSFLHESIGSYEFSPADIDPIRGYAQYIQSKLTQDIGKAFEELVRSTLLPNWKMIFHADNYIDTGRTLEEQRDLIAAIIHSIETTGKVSHLPSTMAKVINEEFLNTEYRRSTLLEELHAEHRLTDPSIDWISACLDRARVMYYSVLVVMNADVVRLHADRFYSIFYDGTVHAVEPFFTKEEIEVLYSEAQ